MWHWYLLAKHSLQHRGPAPTDLLRHRGSTPLDFTALGGLALSSGLSRRDELRMFALGAVETLPLVIGAGVGHYWGDGVTYGVAGFIGLLLTGILCWLLRGQMPQTVIHITSHVVKQPGGSH